MAARSRFRRMPVLAEPPTLLDLLTEAYPVPDPYLTQESSDRYFHRDVVQLDRVQRARELAIVRLIVFLGGPAWFEVREAALLGGAA